MRACIAHINYTKKLRIFNTLNFLCVVYYAFTQCLTKAVCDPTNTLGIRVSSTQRIPFIKS